MTNQPAPLLNDRQRFYALASAAIREGRITPAEVNTIARVGHRKQNYWRRHLRDLRAVLEERRATQAGHHG